MKRKIVQVIQRDPHKPLTVLCNDGTIWELYKKTWYQKEIPEIPSITDICHFCGADMVYNEEFGYDVCSTMKCDFFKTI